MCRPEVFWRSQKSISLPFHDKWNKTWATGEAPWLKADMCSRDVHHDSRVLVCSQHHAAVLRPVLSWHKVSLHKPEVTWPFTVSSRATMLQVWDRRGLVHRLVFSHAGHLRRIVSVVCLQGQDTQRKNVSLDTIFEWYWSHVMEDYQIWWTSCAPDHTHINYRPEDAGWQPHQHPSPFPATMEETLTSDSHRCNSMHAQNALLLQMHLQSTRLLYSR